MTMVKQRDIGNYIIYSDGRIYSKHYNKNRFLKHYLNKRGYVSVYIGKHRPLHRVLAEAFIPNPNGKPCINHKNGIRNDNRLSNLEWCTDSENMKHAYDTGLHPIQRGSDRPNAKLDDVSVKIIKEAVDKGFIKRSIARYFKIDPCSITDIIMGRTWSHVK